MYVEEHIGQNIGQVIGQMAIKHCLKLLISATRVLVKHRGLFPLNLAIISPDFAMISPLCYNGSDYEAK